jgi:hypothetical protein
MRRPSPLTAVRLAVLVLALAGLAAFLSSGSSNRGLVAEIERDCRRAHGGRDPEIVQRCMISEVAKRRVESGAAAQ